MIWIIAKLFVFWYEIWLTFQLKVWDSVFPSFSQFVYPKKTRFSHSKQSSEKVFEIYNQNTGITIEANIEIMNKTLKSLTLILFNWNVKFFFAEITVSYSSSPL